MQLMSKLLLFILYSAKSFEDVEVWLKDLKTYSSPDIKVILIGNKTDLEESRQISERKIAEDYKMVKFLESLLKLALMLKKCSLKQLKFYMLIILNSIKMYINRFRARTEFSKIR